MTKKEKIYIITQFLVSFCGLTWVQMAYNDPVILLSKSTKEILTLMGISLGMVLANTGIVWLAYLSDPKQPTNNNHETPPGPVNGGSSTGT